jgi:hypothetical protein
VKLLIPQFFVILARRLGGFVRREQLTVPILLFVVIEVWRIATGRLTLTLFKRNPGNELLPYIATVGLIVIFQIVFGCRDVYRELRDAPIKNPPKIIGYQPKAPSRLLVSIVGLALIAVVVLAEGLAVEFAYPEDRLDIATVIQPPGIPEKPMASRNHLDATPAPQAPSAEQVATRVAMLQNVLDGMWVAVDIDLPEASIARLKTAHPKIAQYGKAGGSPFRFNALPADLWGEAWDSTVGDVLECDIDGGVVSSLYFQIVDHPKIFLALTNSPKNGKCEADMSVTEGGKLMYPGMPKPLYISLRHSEPHAEISPPGYMWIEPRDNPAIPDFQMLRVSVPLPGAILTTVDHRELQWKSVMIDKSEDSAVINTSYCVDDQAISNHGKKSGCADVPPKRKAELIATLIPYLPTRMEITTRIDSGPAIHRVFGSFVGDLYKAVTNQSALTWKRSSYSEVKGLGQ